MATRRATCQRVSEVRASMAMGVIIALGLLVYVQCRHGIKRTRKERAHKDPQYPTIPKQRRYSFPFFVFPQAIPVQPLTNPRGGRNELRTIGLDRTHFGYKGPQTLSPFHLLFAPFHALDYSSWLNEPNPLKLPKTRSTLQSRSLTR